MRSADHVSLAATTVVASAPSSYLLLLPVLASLAYLAPAYVAMRAHRLWQAAIFTVLMILCAAKHVVDFETADEQHKCDVQGCQQGFAARSAGAWAFFCTLQIAFMYLGPEDPRLQAPDWQESQEPLRGKLRRLIPEAVDASNLLRAFTAVVLYAALVLPVDLPEGLWRRGALVSEGLLCCGCAAFWLIGHNRRLQAGEVLLRSRFWKRAGIYFALPSSLVVLLAVGARVTGSVHVCALMHIVAGAAAAWMLQTAFVGTAEEMSDHSPDNSLVPHRLLCGPASIALPAVLLTMLAVAWESGSLMRCQPSLTMISATEGGAFALNLVGPPLAIATLGAIWVIENSPGRCMPLIGVPMMEPVHAFTMLSPDVLRRWGCKAAYAAAVFGLIASLQAHGDGVTVMGENLCSASGANATKTGLTAGVRLTVSGSCAWAILFFVASWASALLYAVSSDTSAPDGRLRFILATIVTAGLPLHGVLWLISERFGSEEEISLVPHWLHSLSGYVHVILLTSFPMTWWPEVKAMRLQFMPEHSPFNLK